MHAKLQFSDQAMGDKIYIKSICSSYHSAYIDFVILYKKLFTYKPMLDAEDLVLYRREPRYIYQCSVHIVIPRDTENRVACILIKLYNSLYLYLLRFRWIKRYQSIVGSKKCAQCLWIHICKSQWVHRSSGRNRFYYLYTELLGTFGIDCTPWGDSIQSRGAAGLTITCCCNS